MDKQRETERQPYRQKEKAREDDREKEIYAGI